MSYRNRRKNALHKERGYVEALLQPPCNQQSFARTHFSAIWYIRTLSRAVLEALGGIQNVTYICHDYYYRDLSHLPVEERAKTNFDHPDALETELMCSHLAVLKAGGSADVPVYDFTVHGRAQETIRAEGKGVIIVEGILIFADPALRDLLDVKIFVDTEPDIRFIRRMQRDIAERNRTADDVVTQYHGTVRPMHELFVAPSKKFCDIIVPDGLNPVVLDMIVAKLRSHVKPVLGAPPSQPPGADT